jgi:hypothetical protein
MYAFGTFHMLKIYGLGFGNFLKHQLLEFVKTQRVARSRGQRCGDIELAAYLAMRRVRCLRC